MPPAATLPTSSENAANMTPRRSAVIVDFFFSKREIWILSDEGHPNTLQ